jgi:hypothetical protein
MHLSLAQHAAVMDESYVGDTMQCAVLH